MPVPFIVYDELSKFNKGSRHTPPSLLSVLCMSLWKGYCLRSPLLAKSAVAASKPVTLLKKTYLYFFLGHRGIWKITAFLSSNVLENGTVYPSAVAAPGGGNVSTSGGLPSSSLSTHTSKLLAHTCICTCANAHTRTLARCLHTPWELAANANPSRCSQSAGNLSTPQKLLEVNAMLPARWTLHMMRWERVLRMLIFTSRFQRHSQCDTVHMVNVVQAQSFLENCRLPSLLNISNLWEWKKMFFGNK